MTPATLSLVLALAQVTARGGSTVVVLLALLALVTAAVLAVVVAYRIGQGYRQTGDRARLFLAVGLFLLVTVPIVLRFVLATFDLLPATTSSALTTGIELVGLLAIVYTIYGNP